jgi:hypothetical protein
MTLPRGCDLETDTHPRWLLVGVFLTCMCGLMLQIIETRVLSVLANYTLAFVAILRRQNELVERSSISSPLLTPGGLAADQLRVDSGAEAVAGAAKCRPRP